MKSIVLFSSLALLVAFTSGIEFFHSTYVDYNWSLDGNSFIVYTCWVNFVSVENPTTVTKITGFPLPGRSDTNVKGFRMDGPNNLPSIPSGIENFFPNLLAFAWPNGNLSTIDSSTLKPFPNLVRISLNNNKIVNLNSDLFQYTRKLQYISFQQNWIQYVGQDLLTGLTALTFVDFTTNSCIRLVASLPQQIEQLKLQLRIQCPPLATSTTSAPQSTKISTTAKPNECPIGCMERIVELERAVRELSSKTCSCKPN